MCLIAVEQIELASYRVDAKVIEDKEGKRRIGERIGHDDHLRRVEKAGERDDSRR